MKRFGAGAYRISGEGAFQVLARAQALERAGRSILHLEIGEPDMATPPHVARAGIEAIEAGRTRYCAAAGLPELREALRDEVARTRGYRPDLEQVLVTPGLKPGIFLTLLALLEPGDEVLLPDPCFPTYRSVAAHIGAVVVPVRLREEHGFAMDPGEIRSLATARTKLLVVNSPHNPTGAVMTSKRMEEIAALAEELDLFLLSDEVYSRMIYDGANTSPTIRDAARHRSILLDGFSKSHAMTGWRLGWLVAPRELAGRLSDYIVNAFSCTPPFTQLAGVAALRGDHAFLDQFMARLRVRRDRIVAGVRSIPGRTCAEPGGAFFAFAGIQGTGLSSKTCADRLLEEAGVAVLPGTAFGPGGEGFIRFSYATSLEIIDEAVERIRRELAR